MMNLFGETPVRKLLTLHALSGETLVEETATPGNPCTFETDAAKALTECKVLFTPVQSGSGDPSPENVRPITGWTGIHAYHSGEDETDYDTYAVSWQTEAGTVYGGNLDLTTGVLTVTLQSIDLGDLSWTYYPNVTRFRTEGIKSIIVHAESNSNTNGVNAICSCYTLKSYNGTSSNNNSFGIATDGGVTIHDERYTDGTTLANAIKGEILVYELATPQTIQLTAQQITALIGENNLWSDANGNLEVKYMKKG